ncbi:MAG: hypothetical protein IJ017_05725 [Oscillospiraceae bacterium]|nr:hypothetical protein [Oscillospiraceae bacterium]
MKYERPEYLAEGIKVTEFGSAFFGDTVLKVPVFDRPISIRENFKRAYKRENPVWVPNALTDGYVGMLAQLNGMPDADWSRNDRYGWTDWFGAQWTYVPEAGGPMLTPGTQFLDDITNWKTGVKFPDLDLYDWETNCKKFMDAYDGEKVIAVNIGLGCTERLVSLLGGYTEAMLAMAIEPETVREFLEAFVDWEITVVDKVLEYVPVDMITYHDDWGTERDTFFSEKMMEEIVFEPTKRLFGHIKSKGVCVELHSCGHIARFIPYMIEMGVDLMQIQTRCNDIAAYKVKYGDKIGFDLSAMPEGDVTADKMIQAVRELVDNMGAGGGLYAGVFSGDPEVLWHGTSELYYYSREKYERE